MRFSPLLSVEFQRTFPISVGLQIHREKTSGAPRRLRPDEAIEPSWEAAYYVGFVKTYYNQREEGSGGGDPSHPGAWRPD